MILNVLFALAIVGWVIKKVWETSYSKRTGNPPENLWKNPPQKQESKT
jgi:hypothetical protein